MLITLKDGQILESDNVSSIVEAESVHKPIPGAAFDFKPDTLVTMKNSQVIRLVGQSPEDVLATIKQQAGTSVVGVDYLPILEDLLKTVEAIKEHAHTTSEMITRLVLERK
jgi:hypothetical protein